MSENPPASPVPPVPPASDATAVTPPAPNPYAQPNPYPQPNPYAQNPYAQPNPYGAAGQPYAPGVVAPKTNTLAIVSLCLALFVSVAAIICGHIALSQIKRTGESGRGLALAGVIVGYVVTGFWVLYFIFFIVIVVLAASTGGYSSSTY
ncbi:DUF4190 domain-containing protein [Lysinimonas soli]|uniref:DUF4190 domain-containing protein n=1 Tax=Lysinimonas soli TaxID=1074233 RepID=A0ABW0NU24_9MICO